MKVLVTGGAGFIGSHVAEALLAEGAEVLVIDDLSTGKRENVPPGARLRVVDVRDAPAVREAVLGFRPDAVSHQAAQASVSVSVRDPRLDVSVNVIGSLNLLESCSEAGVGRVVFASTGGAIYGEVPEGQRAAEEAPARPFSPYAISKLAVEQLLEVFRVNRGLDYTVLRYANVYGPRQDPHGEAGVIAIFMQSVLEGRPLRVNARRSAGDGGCIRDYVFVGDVVRANVAALRGAVQGRVLNVGAGTTTSTAELAETIFGLAGRRCELVSAPPRAGDLERSVLNPERYVALLGEPTALAKGLAPTWRWYLESTGPAQL
jgi:UDP-glucose 4-epimerase